jgi:hypothetical protein
VATPGCVPWLGASGVCRPPSPPPLFTPPRPSSPLSPPLLQAREHLFGLPLTVSNIRDALDRVYATPRVPSLRTHRRLQRIIKGLPKPRLKSYLNRRMHVLQAVTTGTLKMEVGLGCPWVCCWLALWLWCAI